MACSCVYYSLWPPSNDQGRPSTSSQSFALKRAEEHRNIVYDVFTSFRLLGCALWEDLPGNTFEFGLTARLVAWVDLVGMGHSFPLAQMPTANICLSKTALLRTSCHVSVISRIRLCRLCLCTGVQVTPRQFKLPLKNSCYTNAAQTDS
jgi:hypothetical protein